MHSDDLSDRLMPRNILYSLLAAFLIVLCIAVLGVVSIMPKLTSIDAQNQSVVELALADSPLAHAQKVQWFTGGAAEQTVVGKDALGRAMYVIALPDQQLIPVYASSIVSAKSAVATFLRLHPDGGSIVSTTLGLLKNAAVPSSLSWEIVSRLPHGQFSYTFLSAQTDRQLWNFVTSDTFRLWDQ
ncbi:MAG: hypothetical protein OWT28_10150 [Firmicutes bacterium]|nr:hypothetical protein [Bacillota bacterium]